MSTTERHVPGRAGRGRTVRASGGLLAWRGLDLVTTAVLGVAFGVVFIVWDYALNTPWTGLTSAFPPAGSLALGVWLLPAVAGGLLVRRPGAALLCEMIAALLEFWLGNPWGAGVLVSGLLQGAGAEIGFALLGFRRFGPVAAMLAGAVAAALPVVAYEWWTYSLEYSWPWKLASLGFSVTSGVLLAGLGAWALVRALARAGAIDAFPAGREHLAARG